MSKKFYLSKQAGRYIYSDINRLARNINDLKDELKIVSFRVIKVEEKVDNLSQDFYTFKKETNQRFDELSDQVKNNTNKIDSLSKQVESNSNKIDSLSKQVDNLSEQVQDNTNKIDSLSKQVDDLSEQVQDNTIK